MSEEMRYGKCPLLELRHPNGRETGSALRMSLTPATVGKPGYVTLALADQIVTEGTRCAPDYKWESAVSVDLGAVDLAKLLTVFMGWTEGTDSDGSGDNTIRLQKENGDLTTVDLRHKVEPGPTYVLTIIACVLHQSKTAVQIALSSVEALAISEAIRGAMHRVAFGDTILCMGMDFGEEVK